MGSILKLAAAEREAYFLRAASFFETTSRNETFCALASNFIQGYCRDASPEAGGYDGRMVLPLCATAGAPGTGKSRLLDDVWRQLPVYLADDNRVPQLDSEDLQRVAELRDLLGHCIPLLVTDDGWSMASRRDAKMPAQYLALRVLATYFFKFGPSAGFGDAFDQIAWWASHSSSFGMLSLTAALDAIMIDNVGSGIRGFYLGADELERLQGADPSGKALRAVLHTIAETSQCRMQSDQWKLLHVVTSHSATVLRTSTERDIDWMLLKPLKSEPAVCLLADKYPRLAKLHAFEASIHDCGGHPRSLERLCISTIDDHYRGLAIWKDDSSQLKRREVSYSTSEPCMVKTLAPDWDKGKEQLDMIDVFKSQLSSVATTVGIRFMAAGKGNSTTDTAIDHMGKLFNDIKVSKALPALSLLVFVSGWDMAKSILDGKTRSHDNVVVIPKERLNDLYGPTLGHRLEFMLSMGEALPPTVSLQCVATEMSAKFGM
eukprot:m51a1_g13743 hypothetical protein (489) ;mRNA; f:178672-181301